MSKACKWFEVCPIKKFFDDGKLDEKLVQEYCFGDFRDCVRYRLKAEGKPHPNNMLPDGTTNEELLK